MSKFRKEPFVIQRQGKTGWTFMVRIRDGVHDITKSFSEKTYGSAKIAYETAVRFKNKTLVELAEGTALKASKATVRDMFEYYLDTTTNSFKTKEINQSYFKNYVSHKDKLIQDLTRADIIEDLNSMVNSCSDTTISRVYGLYKLCIIQPALLQDIVTRDVSLGIKIPQSRVIHIKRGTETDKETLEKIKWLLKKDARDTYCARIICYALDVLYHTGMRPAEVFALTRDDITDDYIDVNKELGSGTDDRNTIRRCKTENSIRKIPISSALRPIIDELLEFSKNYYVFSEKDGSLISVNSVSTKIARKCRLYGIKFNMYRLRHNMATTLVTNHVDDRTTIELLGHANYSMSLYYANSNDELKNEALELIH